MAGTSAPSSLIRAPKQMAARVPVLDLGPGRQGVPGGQRQHQLRGRLLIHLQSEGLTETRNAAAVVQYGIAADLSWRLYREAWKAKRRPSTEVASGRTDASISRRAARKLSSCRSMPNVMSTVESEQIDAS